MFGVSQQVPFFNGWHAHSPDLSPVEHVWNYMKNWIGMYKEVQSFGWRELRAAEWQAWEAVPEELLLQLAY